MLLITLIIALYSFRLMNGNLQFWIMVTTTVYGLRLLQLERFTYYSFERCYNEVKSTDDNTDLILAPLGRVSLQQLRTTHYALRIRTTDIALGPLRSTIGNLQ